MVLLDFNVAKFPTGERSEHQNSFLSMDLADHEPASCNSSSNQTSRNRNVSVGGSDESASSHDADLLMGSFTGTLHYKAPEMLTDIIYSREVDVWALGCTLFELLSGRQAFQHQNVA